MILFESSLISLTRKVKRSHKTNMKIQKIHASFWLFGLISGNFIPKGAQKQTYQHQRSDDLVKAETAFVYDKVGQTGKIAGDLKKAYLGMNYLGYTDQEFSYVFQDAYNYQGVGCPFRFADLQKGETVLDVGSGLGIDTDIALHYVGGYDTPPTGKVVGVELSAGEIKHASEKFSARNMPTNLIKFITGDMENFPDVPEFANNTYDKVISNGAFCLAPNKDLAFSEIYRVLKPGGRMAVATSVMKVNLSQNTHWPLCMDMFILVDEIKPLCEEIGFVNIRIDDENSLMSYEIDTDVNITGGTR